MSLSKLLFWLMEWFMRLAYVNCIWLLFSLPVITLPQSTVSLFTVTGKWIQGETDIPVFKTFYGAFKNNFWKSLQLGVVLLLLISLLYIDFTILQTETSSVFLVLRYGLYVLIILFLITIFYVFPVYLKWGLPWYKCLFVALMVGLSHPVLTFLVICSSLFTMFIFLFWPGIGLFFAGSLNALLISKVVDLRFEKWRTMYG